MAKSGRNSGKVYSTFDFNTMVVDEIPPGESEEKSLVGFDWGWNDPTVAPLITLTNKKNVYITEDFGMEHTSWDHIKLVIAHYKKAHRIVGAYGDPEDRLAMEQMSIKLRMTIQKGNKDISQGISNIRNLIHQNRFFVLRKCKNVLRELKMYRYEEEVDGATDMPRDENNHWLDAIRYVIATYPIPDKNRILKETEKPIPDFWLRRSALYKREKSRYDKLNLNEKIWTP